MDIRTKMELDDIDGYDWNWTEKYLDEFVEDLTKAYMAAYDAEFPDAPLERASPILLDAVQREAAEWALLHGSELIVDIADQTRLLVRQSVGTALLEGLPLTSMDAGAPSVVNLLAAKEHPAFSMVRATLIARTETAYALGVGQLKAAEVQGRDEKHWRTAGDALVSDECKKNEDAKWIPIADTFPSGVSSIPQHPNCRCVVRYRTKRLHEEGVRTDFRCRGCKRLLVRNATIGARMYCRHCKVERVA